MNGAGGGGGEEGEGEGASKVVRIITFLKTNKAHSSYECFFGA